MPSQQPPPAPQTLDAFLCFAIYAASHALNRFYKPLLDELGLTYPQYLALVALGEADGATVGQIGARLTLDSSTLTPLLKRMEAAGHLRRTRDATDERQVRVHLTAAGQALLVRAQALPSCVAQAVGQEPSAIAALRDGLQSVRAALGDTVAA